MAKILVYGSLNIDYVYQVPHFVQPGETLLSFSRSVFAGGKGLNQGVALARAGGNVSFLGAVGQQDGQILLDVLEQSKIDLSLVKRRANEPSGHTFIQVDSKGQNCILLYGGANRSHLKVEVDEALVNFGEGDYLVLQNETNDIAYIIEQAAARGMNVCINASPFDESVFSLPLHLCKYIIVNEIEGAALVDESEDADPYVILKKLKEKFSKSSFLLTLGSRGSLFSECGSDEVICCRAFKVKAVDTTAAGDTFLGYFISQMAEGIEPASALQRATAASAIAVTRQGATPSIPVFNEVMDFVNSHESTICEKL